MSDSFSEVTSQGYFSRLGGAIKGVLAGFVMFLVAFPLLFVNEGCAVKRYKDLAAGRGALVEASSDKVDASNEGKLVYLSGDAKTDEVLQDETFGVEVPGILLRRMAQMYQWKENQSTEKDKKFGGSEETTKTYSYEKVWAPARVDSANFHEQGRAAHQNPESMEVQGKTFQADEVALGAFKLSAGLTQQISAFESVPLTEEMAEQAGRELDRVALREGDEIFLGPSPKSPQIGDIRVSFTAVKAPQTVSLFAAQRGESFGNWQAPSGRTLEQSLAMGVVTPEEMFSKKESERAMMTWIFRGGGFLLMFGGIAMVLRPLSVLADVIPLIGSIVGAGTTIVAFLIAAPLSLLTIAVGWLVYRPLIGIPLVLAAVALLVGLVVLLRKNRGGAAQPVSAESPS